MSRPAAFLITDAYPGTPCQGLRRSTGHCSTPALYVIHVSAASCIRYVVGTCGHLNASWGCADE